MGEDFFLVDIPVFEPLYDAEEKYGWSRYKDNLWNVLKDTTGGYCMYCYDKVWINEQRRGQIEHGIERANSKETLSDCVPNLGLACENCNGKFKRRGENKRKLPISSIKEFIKGDCKKFDCKSPCEKFETLRAEYIKNGKILIQPFEIKIEEGHSLRLQFDLLNNKYIPSTKCGNYNQEELDIINGHIKLFGLNGPERPNREVSKYCKNVIDNGSILEGIPYNNLVVDLFRRKLKQLDVKEAVKVCNIIYSRAWMQSST